MYKRQGKGDILGIAMGTSEAVGYVNDEGNVLGWINELAFAPVDLSPAAMQDEWSGDFGVGCKYFSQDAVIKLAPAAGIELDPELSPAEKLKVVQGLANEGHEGALDIFRSIGVYLAHTLVLYSSFYEIETLLVLGRVASGVGGDLVLYLIHISCSSAWRAPTTTTASCLTASSNGLVSSPTCQEVR